MTFGRAGAALMRRVRLVYFRLRHPRAKFGNGCDIRPGFHLKMGARATVEFAEKCVLDRGLTVECDGVLRVGRNVIFGHHCTLAARELLEIGDDSLIAEMVSIRDHDHCFARLDIPTREQGDVIAPVRVGRNVWLGGKVTVAKGVQIGDHAVVGANAVVTRDIEPRAIAAGVPARVLRLRTAA